MEHDSTRNHAAVPSDGRVPATQPAAQPPARPPALDANGFDPNDYEWRPVPRRSRKDGWAPDVQIAFVQALARTGVVDHACREVGMSVSSAYTLRDAPGAEGFARAWRAALTRAADRVLDVAMQQAIVGEEVPVYDAAGVRVGVKWKYNTRMAMFLLRAYHPDRFRFAHCDARQPGETLPPPPPPMAEVVASLAPETPADPHLLMPPVTLAAAVARAEHEAAKVEAALPDDSYRPEPIPDTHPRVQHRSRRNKERRAWREAREDKLYGLDEETPTPDPTPPDFAYRQGEQADAANIPPALAVRPPRNKRTSLNFPSTSKPKGSG